MWFSSCGTDGEGARYPRSGPTVGGGCYPNESRSQLTPVGVACPDGRRGSRRTHRTIRAGGTGSSFDGFLAPPTGSYQPGCFGVPFGDRSQSSGSGIFKDNYPSIGTEHTLSESNLERYRKTTGWIIGVFIGNTPIEVWQIDTRHLEPIFRVFDKKVASNRGTNNPKIPFSLIRRWGKRIYRLNI